MRTPEQVSTRRQELLATFSEEQVNEMFCNECGSFGFENCHPECPNEIQRVQVIEECAAKGHVIKDEGQNSQESGEILLVCQQCGVEIHHEILY